MYARPRLRRLLGFLVLSVATLAQVTGDPTASPDPHGGPDNHSNGGLLFGSGGSASSTTGNAFPAYNFRFTQSAYNVSIPENSVGKTYAVQAPGDERLGIYVPIGSPEQQLDIKYKIIGGDRDKFFKAEERLVGDFCFLSIRTKTGTLDVLNRERRDRYVLEVHATGTRRDGNQKIVVDTNTVVVVTVLDTNDLNPLFYPIEYEKVVPEDTPLHKSIIRVQAEDADLGRNGEIYYSFLEDTEQFAVHPMSGVITLTRPLQYSSRSHHELTVLGQDRGALFRTGSVQATRAKVRIRVKQVNLYSPEIYVQHLPSIVEDSNADIYAIVRVADKDQGIHGEIKSLDIVDGDPDGHFRIRPGEQKNEYNIEVLRLLDRETTPQGYNLTLRAADKGTPIRQSYKSVPVHLADLNDNAPVFNREIYEVKVPETAPINTPVIRLKVTDPDEGKNAQVFLEIVGGNEGGEFRINPDTGMLYTSVKLDAEQKAFYTLTVSAIDQGNTGTRKQSSAKVKINVVDTNDNDPVFDKPEQTVWIDENEPTGTSVTKVTAKDRDSGENAYISYSIANLKPVPFEIDHFSGVIRTTQVLDYESMRREYILKVRASDWGLPYRRQTEMQLTIKVKDVNDNRPQFEKVDCSGHVPRYVSIGSEIMTLSAIDFDSGNIISYRIVGGNEDGCFNLEATSGVLSVSCDLNDVKVSERDVNVTATDGTHFADVTRIHLNLVNAKRNLGSTVRLLNDETGAFECRDTGVARRLTEVLAAGEKNNMVGRGTYQEEFGMMPSRYGQNIHTPEFIEFPIEIRVNESVPLETTLVKLKARDRDLGYNGKLVYGISSGDDDSVFCVDPETGELRVIGYLDRERENEYYLNVTVYDLGKPQKSSSRVLPVTVLDVNDNAPKFEKALASFRVTENALNGTAIFRANATDADLGDNAKITYSLVTDTKDFSVDPVTGILTVASNLDRERQELYELRIRATDNGGKSGDMLSLYSDALVRISIDDINDQAPTFSLPQGDTQGISVKIREDIPRGSVVAVITAYDPDIGSGGEINYSLVDNVDSVGAFKIDKLSGTIRTTKLLDFEERQVHILTIIAQDRGTPSLSSETTVTVNVVDVNENMYAPVFDDFVLQGSVLENEPPGKEVMRVKAVDQDPPGDDSRINYSIRGGDGIGVFSIDKKGIIRTLAVLDIETKPHYWLTVFAQDHGVVPQFSSVEVFIQVLNVNDNTPLTLEPIYFGSIPENSPGGKSVIQVKATDIDVDPDQNLTYKIVSGAPEGFFAIDSSTGLITTTSRKLDRETQSEHNLEVMVSDNGVPPLTSTTRVVITVEDINDHAPEFEQKIYKIQIPASAPIDKPLFQDDVDVMQQSDSTDIDPDSEIADALLESDSWQTYSAVDAITNGDRAFRVLAFDKDVGKNGEIQYSIKSGRGKAKFRIHPTTGIVYAQRGFEAGQGYELLIRATDTGEQPKNSTCRAYVQVIPVPLLSEHPPTAKGNQSVNITESDDIGFLVALIQASDPDNDTLWFDIVDGDNREEFYIGRDKGNVLLAHQLDRETQDKYNLTISITDMVHVIYIQLYITVIDANDHRPEFSEPLYRVDISEAVLEGKEILRLHATDADVHEKLLYSLHSARHPSSLENFKLNSLTGALTLVNRLDRETISEHLLTVMVRDGGTPVPQRNFARVLIAVHDDNDHAPQFSEKFLEGKVFESATIGSAVLRAFAIDQDKGDNARITYSITSGNIGNVFNIDPVLGIIQVARELDLSISAEYTLQVKAIDHGTPELSASVPAHILLTMADNAPPKFAKEERAAEIYEDQPKGTFVKNMTVRSTSSLQFEILDGNIDDAFIISPSTGIIITNKQLDYETTRFYNLSVSATNMAAASATSNVIIHVLDKNDNAPKFIQAFYEGSITEAASINSLVLTNQSTPLVIKASDADSELNALLNYDIIEPLPRNYFHIDASTGAIRTVKMLDHEKYAEFNFHVKVSDLGFPRLSSETTARVKISIVDINDCAPKFTQSSYNVTLLLPTYQDVTVIQLNATDPDSPELTSLRYDIIDGNKDNIFAIDSEKGIVTVIDSDHIKPRHKLHIRVSDGKFSNIAHVNIKVEKSENSGLTFQKSIYEGSILENSTKITTVCVVNVLGSALNEHIVFNILNPTDMFEIGVTSGAIRTTGKRFDREVKDNYELIVEARSEMPDRDKPRVAHVIVNVTILDVNDNCPMFVNLPYYAVVSVVDQKGDVIHKVHAIDLDSFENSEVRYELIKGHGELFKVNRKTGEIELKQSLEGHNREYELLIAAYDGGIRPCRTEVTVHVKVIDRSMPVFKKQFYSETVPESIELHSTLAVSVEAESPLSRKLIYSIVKGNELEEFALDFNTAPDSNNGPCVISVVDELDYEQRQQYELTIRATDSVSGVYAEVPVSILIQDVNDCPPEFPEDSYNVSVSEAAPFGTPVLKVTTKDNDTGINAVVRYSIEKDSSNSSNYFYIDSADGTIYLKQSLDHEFLSKHHFVVVASDQGMPSLSSTAHVWLTVLDMNDNPPKFELPSYSCGLSVNAARGQFVTVLTASDPDIVDQGRLKYTIVDGNGLQTFSIDSDTGILTLLNLANFGEQRNTLLNISVSDGVYTSFTRLKVELLPANLHSPVFPHIFMEARVLENQLRGHLVTTVKANDEDFGEFGSLIYSIHSELLSEYFYIDKYSGEITTKVKLDREHKHVFEIPIMAVDGGGRSGFMTVRVRVLDENDNAPQFYLREYKASIHSNHSVASPFLKIRAKDIDEDKSAQVKYSIYEKQNSGVSEIFSINPSTGAIVLLKNVIPWESQTFQFFVRATDNGVPPLHSDVPVNVLIMAPSDTPPIFERKDEKFFLTENSPTGTIISRLKMVSNVSVIYRIISGSEENPEFAVDSQGQLTLARPLDFEIQDSHQIGVVAETDGSPPLTALAEVTLQVLDENDHAPQFESSPYIINVAENINEGTDILKVIAHDEDQGSNGEVRYSLNSESGDAVNVFTIDSYTGWISNLIKLDKEEKDEYRFQVIATDNGHPKHSARTTVIVKLKDYNDSPPIFKSSIYEAAVNEDALPGTVVVQLSTVDADQDLNSSVVYYITNGDLRSQFQIRQTGEVYVAKPLDKETIPMYYLDVIATDGMFTATTKVTIEILGVNDNPPYCLRYRYRQVLSEGIHPGSYILSILATDIDGDDHSKLRYYLTGEGADKFGLDMESGHLKTARSLDREIQSKYSLTAHVQDKEHAGWECSSQVEIVVSDLNDNAPSFSSKQYSVALPEDVEVGTLVTKVHATDADIGINRKIKYSFIDSAKDHFKIAPDSGIVTLSKPLDREQCAVYNLTVQAIDQGTPQMSSVAILVVNVQDINDNPPEFASKYYFATVPEIDSVGSEVIRVLATSKDTGVNADIFYSIVGGNEHKKFAIDTVTGVIKISEMLDYERAKDYFLTIQAVDGGNPPLSNLATVNITVLDSNDNVPIFAQMPYSVTIREDTPIEEEIFKVLATDADSGENGRVTYSIKRGDRYSQFAINPDTGYISIANALDRESISTYILEIHAQDNGLPTLASHIDISIEISDANDNPPLFAQQNYTTIVQEDKPLGHSLLKFIVTDADSGPNGAPYTFDFQSGNEGGAFRIEQDGILRTATRFNHKIRDNYLLHIRVFDNGTPPLYSDTFVVVKVIEESQYPPVITPLDIVINSFLDEYPGGVIGKVFASDQDQYDTLTYAISPTYGNPYPMTDLFQIDRTDGTLRAYPRLDVGDYRLNVSVTDSKFYAFAVVKVYVEIISQEMLDHSIVVRFREVTPEEFVLSHRKGFIRTVRNAMNSRLKDVIIISVQPSNDDVSLNRRRSTRELYRNESFFRTTRDIKKDLDVMFTVRKPQPSQHAGAFFPSDTIRKALNDNLEELEESTKLVVEEIVRMKCTSSHCKFGKCKDRIVLDVGDISTISTDVTSFVSPKHEHRIECDCKEGYGGDRCDTVINDCANDPCPVFKICIPDASILGFTCQCPEGFAGSTCDIDISKCHDESCYIPRNPVSFNGKSYAQYKVNSIDEKLSFSLRIRTLQPTGTLMYAAGSFDYNILEIVKGAIQYRFELGSGEGMIRVSTLFVSDGHWHEVKLERDSNTARLTVDGSHVAHGSSPGINDILNLQDNDLYLGSEVKQHPTILGFEDVQRGFAGCMDDVRISRVSVPLHKSGPSFVASLKRFANVEFSCDASSILKPIGACGSQPCQNGGTCHEAKGGFECQCHARFIGRMCEIDTDPCGSSPCLYGGRCSLAPGNDFICECTPRLNGKRCEYGHYCLPNPCRHGGACEEGDTGPLCKCRAWTGDFCEHDLNECETGPCQNGGTCINEPGSYKCVCPPNMTGLHCGNAIQSPTITSNIYSITWEELFIIIITIIAIFLIVLIFITYRRCHVKRNRQRASNINNETREKSIVLNSARPHELVELKRGSKLSNLEVNQRDQPICPPRPVSYTPSSNNEPPYNTNAAVLLNNLDTLRSYGSAGDELENVPPDYLRNLNRSSNTTNGGVGCGSDSDSLHKPTWAEQMHLASFSDSSKIKNDLKQASPICDPPPRFLGNRSNAGRTLMNGCHMNTMEDDPRLLGGYHWDCSDWVRRSQNPLPDITEVPGSEVPDSSSFHSNESNESRSHHLPPVLGPIDSTRDIETLNEEHESEGLGESDCGKTGLNALDSGNEEYRFSTDSFLRHPNSYLPMHGYNIPSETEGIGECNPLHSPSALSDHDVEPYGFPSNRNRRKHDDDIGSVITTLDERHSLLGGCASNSDLSTNLCEIEDSECENEIKPLNWISTIHQTSV